MAKAKHLKIDIFPHIVPLRYRDALVKELPADSYWRRVLGTKGPIYDMESRFKIMDVFENYAQVLTISAPPIELVVGPEKASELCIIGNDSMAELVQKYPDRFLAAVGCLPMNNIPAALKEIDRIINKLAFKGIQLYTPINDKPLDSPEFMPIYEKMVKYDLPIWIHPYRPENYADYKTETMSMNRIYHRFGWPYETTAAMSRLVYSGVLAKYPSLKFITHHCGGMVPYFATRTEDRSDIPANQRTVQYEALTKPASEYFKMFYGDTANIPAAALYCGHQFFGTGHVVFGTDMPYGERFGDQFIRAAIEGIEKLQIAEEEKSMIFEGNARKLLKLDK
jgi:predicted TIM-barrel fold metal-dependent hydrolase